MPLDLRLMRYVIAVADEGGFQKAAERLHMAQPPLSRQIRDLERELGVQLFHRRPTRLTEPGRVFVESARQVLAEAERTVQRTRRTGGAGNGTVRLGYTLTAAYDEAPKLLAVVADRHPDMNVEAREAWDAELTAALEEGDIDVALGRHLPAPAAFAVETLRRERFAAVLSVDHPLAARDAVTLRELRGETFRFFPRRLAPGYHDAVLAVLGSTGERFDVWENPIPGLRNLSLRGGGFTILPRSVAGQLPPGVTPVPIGDELPTIDLELIWKPEADSPAALVAQTARRLARDEGWT